MISRLSAGNILVAADNHQKTSFQMKKEVKDFFKSVAGNENCAADSEKSI